MNKNIGILRIFNKSNMATSDRPGRKSGSTKEAMNFDFLDVLASDAAFWSNLEEDIEEQMRITQSKESSEHLIEASYDEEPSYSFGH
jgi:hypothetical protein